MREEADLTLTQNGKAVDISVIIVNFNAGEYILKCVDSVLKVHPHAEIIIVDNASSDNSLEAIEKSYPDHERIHIKRNQANLGFAKGCNLGAREAKSDYLLFLNPDCVVAPDALSKLKTCIESQPGVGMVGAYLVNPDGSEQAGGRRTTPTPWRSFVRAFGFSFLAKRYPKIFSDFLLHKQPRPVKPIQVEAISGSCMLVRGDAFKDVGPLDEHYFLHCEDLDWCMRFRQKGWKILFDPNAQVLHYKGISSRSCPIFVEWHKHKGMVRFYKTFFRHQYPGVLMWLVTIGVWLRFVLKTIYLSTVSSTFLKTKPCMNFNATREMKRQKDQKVKKHVGVLGANSMVGECMLPLLALSDHAVAAFSRHAPDEQNSVMCKGKVVWNPKEGEITHWISLVPIWALPDYFSMLSERGVRRVVALSSTSGVTKSASSDPAEQETAERIKKSEEAFVTWADSNEVEWIILRPTLIYGLGKDKNIMFIARMIRLFGFFPLLGEGHGLRQPVHVMDLAQGCYAAMELQSVKGRTYTLSGGETLSYREMVGRVFVGLNRKPRFVRVPLWMFRLLIAGLRILPRFRFWSPAMAERMNRDMVFDHSEAANDLGFSPRPFRLTREDYDRKELT